MRRSVAFILFSILLCTYSFAQTTYRPVGEVDASKVGIESAQQHLQDITVEKFEDAGFWRMSMPLDQGSIVVRRLTGTPFGKQTLDAERLAVEDELGIPEGNYVLGVRVDFFRRGMNYFYVYPIKPIAIEGISKTISLWVIGRNYNHVLKLIVLDFFGQVRELTLGKLNHTGWKKMTVAVPPNIVQTDYHYTDRNGIKVIGLKIECDLVESHGQYYVYFDDMSAVTDLFLESTRDEDDMADIW